MLIFLRETGKRIGLAGAAGGLLQRRPQPEVIEHGVRSLVAQQVYALTLGYEDLTDHDLLHKDSVLALLVGKQDMTGEKRLRVRGNALARSIKLNRLESSTRQAAATWRIASRSSTWG